MVTLRRRSKQAVSTPRTAAVALAVAAGALVPIQARINGQLAERMADGIGAASLSFLGGLLVLTLVAGVSPGLRSGMRRLAGVVHDGAVPRRYLLAGVLGASLAFAQATTALRVGVAVFTVAVIAGQTLSGLVIDTVGIGGGRARQPLDVPRVLGAVLILVGALIAAGPQLADAPNPARAAVPALMPLGAGVLLGLQQAMNGASATAARSPFAATWVSFFVGAVVLASTWVAKSVATGAGALRLPHDWWLYLGGICGVLFIGLSAALVRRLGVLLLTVGLVAGQLAGSVALELATPTGGGGVSRWSVLGTGLTMIAVAVVARHGLVSSSTAQSAAATRAVPADRVPPARE